MDWNLRRLLNEKDKILIFGGRGWIAGKYGEFFKGAVLSSVDIANPFYVSASLDRVQPDVVINAAGKTGRPNIDWCEHHREETFRSNVTGPMVLAGLCARRDIYLVHLSSGCVF